MNSMKYFITILLIALPLITKEGTSNRRHYEKIYEREVELRKHTLLMAVMWTETRLGAVVETPTSKKENAVGILQIRPGMVQYLNMMGNQFRLSDRKDSLKSVEMFFKFQELINPEFEFEYGCHIWNAGHNRVKQRWHLTEKYRLTAKEYAYDRHEDYRGWDDIS